MLSKSRIKFIRSLRLTKFRIEEQLFIVEGDKMVNEALDAATNPNFRMHSIYGVREWLDSNIPENLSGDIETYQVTSKELSQISDLKTPNSVLALMKMANQDIKKIKTDAGPFLCLDELQDPGNLGTIMRIADWFGLRNLILGENSVDPLSPKVVQASMGSVFRVFTHKAKLDEYIRDSRGSMPVYGAVMDGDDIYQENLHRKSFIVLGNESRGINPDIEKLINKKITIPSPNQHGSGPESLNVSVACGIILSEFFR